MCRSQPSVAATTTPLAKRENYSKEELLAVFDYILINTCVYTTLLMAALLTYNH